TTVVEFWGIVRKRKWLILSVAAAFVILNGVRTLMETPLYTSTVRLQIDTNVAKILEGDNVMPVDNSSSDFMRTQYELLQSRTMGERVVSSLKLTNDPDFIKPRYFSIISAVIGLFSSPRPVANPMELEPAAVGTVLGNVAVRPVTGS